ncbi:nitrophenyl compound nitroreductase subunit ArsF family protein [Alkalitalea saponilacus]|uniref:Thioredoxin domain-containing protein n=1 Tax=Alkalitalea saponilacus TaxID=889453 RepID=A0A1T5HSY5_9BACT|nr:nitrophenyl compound nitroreductase subunit ArsF family protein [Alkalitalea saponilacus]ASB49237.1 hypothetical protein CDL62_08845 [Alkalitalea saponilacus]SKC23722.1 hypothetical protein SAMN03080601_03007 [Alkalitalea saponilacus]
MIKRTFLAIAVVLAVISCGQSQSGQSGQKSASLSEADDAKVKVYYFHGRMRCPTCVNIQEVVQNTVNDNFAGNEDVAFLEVDFSDRANAHLADKYEIAWSSVVIATEDEHTNITEQAFAMVMNNPEGLKSLVMAETQKFLDK